MAINKTAATFRKSGDTLDYTASGDIDAGTIVIADGLVCIAQWPIASGETAALKVLQRGEVIEVTTDEAIGATLAGVAVYVTSAGLVTKTSTSNTLLGYIRAAVGATDLSFEVVCS